MLYDTDNNHIIYGIT